MVNRFTRNCNRLDPSDYLASIHAGLASFYEPDDMYIGNYIGALYQINTGSTTIVDWCHNNPTPDHTDAMINGLIDSKVREFSYMDLQTQTKKGMPHYSEIHSILEMKSSDLRRVIFQMRIC